MTPDELYAAMLVALEPQGRDTMDVRADTLRAVVEHHQPEEWDRSWVCCGCDNGDYAQTSPEAPCSTLKLIARLLGIEVSE